MHGSTMPWEHWQRKKENISEKSAHVDEDNKTMPKIRTVTRANEEMGARSHIWSRSLVQLHHDPSRVLRLENPTTTIGEAQEPGCGYSTALVRGDAIARMYHEPSAGLI